MVRHVFILVAVLACGGKSEDVAPAPSGSSGSDGSAEPAKPVVPGQLRVEIDGKPVTLGRAFVKRVSPDHWRVHVTDRGGSCEELLSGVTAVEPGSSSFVATIRKLVSPDGFESAFVTELVYGGKPSDTAPGTPTKMIGSTDKGAKVEIDLAELLHVDGKLQAKISGKVVAEGCGDQPSDGVGVPKAPHPSTATITLSGKQLPLRGAVLYDANIVLSTGQKDCSSVTPFAQVVVEAAGDDWKLAGTWIGGTADTKPDMKKVEFKVGKPGTSPDGPTVPVTLSGAGTLAGYPVKFAGTIEALDCPPPK